MKAVTFFTLLLAAITLVTGDGGAISVFNNGTYNSGLHLHYLWKSGLQVKEYDSAVTPGETKTIAIPEGAESTQFFVHCTCPGGPDISFDAHSSKPLKLCFKTWGNSNDPQLGQVQCNSTASLMFGPGAGGAILVFNNATFGSKVSIDYELKDGQGTTKNQKESPINPGETKTIAIPVEAKDIYVDFASPKVDHILFNARFSKSVKLCLKIWGTADKPQSGQIDCYT